MAQMKTKPPSPAEHQGKEILDAKEVAALLGIKKSLSYRLITYGSIRSFKVGRLRRVQRAEVDRYIARQMDETT